MGEVVQYGYDDNAALESLFGDSTYVNSINYDYMGRITQLVRGAAVLTTDYSYYSWSTQGGRLQSLETSNSTSTLQDLAYNYDQVGNIQAIDDIVAGETLSYTYDTLNRLIGFYINAALTEAYSFDSQGRLSSKGGETYAYGDSSHVHAATAMGSNSYSYDQNGSMMTRNVPEGNFILVHNAENRLVQVTGPFTNTYIYDGDRNLVVALIQTTDTVTTTILTGNYYEYETIYTISGTEVVTTSYYYAGSTRVAMRKNGVLAYILSDHLGSSTLTTDASGVKTSEQKYMPYGESRGTNKVETDYTFTGQRSYSQINLTHMGARWYDPALGRFTQPDIIVPEPYFPRAYDRFAYVYNNPVRYTDSSGHWIDGISTWACVAVIAGLVLKAIDYGWTAWDAYQSGKVLNDPNASQQDKLAAGLNIGLAIVFEAIEPDDLFPAGLPLDDVARRTVMKGAREAFEEGGTEAFEKFLRDNLGDYADDVFKQMDQALGIGTTKLPGDPGQLDHIFRDASGHFLENTLENRNLLLDTVSWDNFKQTDDFGNQWFAKVLDNGTEIWVQVRDGIIQNGGLNDVPRW